MAGEKNERLYGPATREKKGGHLLYRGRGLLRVRTRYLGREVQCRCGCRFPRVVRLGVNRARTIKKSNNNKSNPAISHVGVCQTKWSAYRTDDPAILSSLRNFRVGMR